MAWLPIPTWPSLPWTPLAEGPSDDAKVVLVTGASSGIGRATALLAARSGDRLALLSRDEETLDELAVECLRAGAESAQVVTADVQQDAEVAQAVKDVVAEHGRLDAVLHCAGVVAYGRTEEVDPDDFEAVLATNLMGSVTLARHVVPVFREQEHGVLVLVGSLLGHIGVPEMTPYVVSKWGVRALARQLAMENSDLRGVRIAHVAPGSVDTPIYGKALSGAGTDNSPPPPVISPQRAARTVYRQIAHARGESQTAWANYLLIGAFNLVPGVWNRLAGPLFNAVSQHRPDDEADEDAEGSDHRDR